MSENDSVIRMSIGDTEKATHLVGLKNGMVIEYETAKREPSNNYYHLTGIHRVFIPGIDLRKSENYGSIESDSFATGIYINKDEVAWKTEEPEKPVAKTIPFSV